jgi:hypothetical protein
VPYPTSCSPQAWAAATPFSLLRSLLRFDPELPAQQVRCAPEVPDRYLPLRISGLRVSDLDIGIDIRRQAWHITGLAGTGIELTSVQGQDTKPGNSRGHGPGPGPTSRITRSGAPGT